MVPAAQGQRPASARKRALLSEPCSTTICTRSPSPTVALRSSLGEGEAQIVQRETFARLVSQQDPTRVPPGRVGCPQGLAQRDDAQQGRPPVGDPRKVVDEPAERLLHLVERTDHHDQPAKGQAAAEVARCYNQDRRDQGEPAVTRGHPGQPGQAARQLAHDNCDATDRSVEHLPLLRFAAMESDALGILIDAGQGKAEFRLTGVARSV